MSKQVKAATPALCKSVTAAAADGQAGIPTEADPPSALGLLRAPPGTGAAGQIEQCIDLGAGELLGRLAHGEGEHGRRDHDDASRRGQRMRWFTAENGAQRPGLDDDQDRPDRHIE